MIDDDDDQFTKELDRLNKVENNLE